MNDLTIAERIKATDLYQSGEPFGALRMAHILGVTRQHIAHAMGSLRSSGDVTMCGHGLYMKHERHLVHSRRLAKPVYDPERGRGFYGSTDNRRADAHAGR
jgi:hypothetical protein